MGNLKQIGIWGYGREGQAAFNYLKRLYPDAGFTILSDDELSTIPNGTAHLFGRCGIKAISSGDFNMIVKSPGISLYRSEIALAKEKGTKITSVTNLWFERYSNSKIVGVTGTKGKSTTARLIHYILKQQGVESVIAGNVGMPLLDCEAGIDITIIELSSYQIADLEYAPDYSVITNLYPEHVPWHNNSLEQYYEDKLRLVNLSDETKVISNSKNKELSDRLKNRENTIWYSNKFDCSSFPLKGRHNISNLNAAITLVKELGYRTDIDLSDFEQLPHRLQELGTIDGRLFVNDSISTVPQATLAALEAYKGRPITLIMGGQDRGQDYTEFAKKIADYSICSIMLLPNNGSKISASLEGKKYRQFNSLERAVKASIKETPEGGIILLSPAAPSFGQFSSFEQRGNCFAKASGF